MPSRSLPGRAVVAGAMVSYAKVGRQRFDGKPDRVANAIDDRGVLGSSA